MFNRPKTDLDIAIDDATLRVLRADTESIRDTCLTNLERLHKLRNDTRSEPVSRNTLVTAGANLVGIAVIVGYEQRHVVTSKALSFLGKLK